MHDSKHEYFVIVEPVEEQVFRKSCDVRSPHVPQGFSSK